MSNELIEQQSQFPVAPGFGSAQSFELMQRVSKAFSSSELVPEKYRGNVANCMIAVDMSNRMGASPLMVMQNLYVVHGNPGWSAKFLIATINASGNYSSLRYEWKGEPGAKDYGCRAWAIERDTDQRLDGIWVTWEMVRAEGWDAKNGSKWKTMPDQMFIYRAAAFWQRAYAPEIGMGLQTVEELADIIDVTPNKAGQYTMPDQDGVIVPALDDVLSRIDAADIPTLDAMRKEIQKLPADEKKEALARATKRAAELKPKEAEKPAEVKPDTPAADEPASASKPDVDDPL